MITELVHPPLAAWGIDGDAAQSCYDCELALVQDAIPQRQREFSRGRFCAHEAIRRLGESVSPVLAKDSRKPIWPSGLLGSITHCKGYTAAVVGRTSDFVGIGIDVEENSPLPEGVWEVITTADERWQYENDLNRFADRSLVAWDRLWFSAKESVYKAWSCLTDQWLDFQDCTIQFDRVSTSFCAEIKKEIPQRAVQGAGEDLPLRWVGKFVWTKEHLLTLVTIPATFLSTPPSEIEPSEMEPLKNRGTQAYRQMLLMWLFVFVSVVRFSEAGLGQDNRIGIPAYSKSPDIVWMESLIDGKQSQGNPPQLAAKVCEFRYDRSVPDSNAQAQWMMLWLHAVSHQRVQLIDWAQAPGQLQAAIDDIERMSGKVASSRRALWVAWKKTWCRSMLNQHALAASQAVPGRVPLQQWLLQSIRLGLDACDELEQQVRILQPDKGVGVATGSGANVSSTVPVRITSAEILDLQGEIELLRADFLRQRCEAYPVKSDDRIAAATELLTAIDQAAGRLPGTWTFLPLLDIAKAEAELELDRVQAAQDSIVKQWSALEANPSPEAKGWRIRLASLGAKAARRAGQFDRALSWLERAGGWETSPELALEYFAIQMHQTSSSGSPDRILQLKQTIAQRFGVYWEQRLDALLIAEPRWKSQLGNSTGDTEGVNSAAMPINLANAKTAIELFRIEARQAIAAKNIELAIEKLQQAETAASKIDATSEAFGFAMQAAALMEQSGDRQVAADEFYRIAISYPEEAKAPAAALMSAWLLREPSSNTDAQTREMRQGMMRERLRETALQWPATPSARTAIELLEPDWIVDGALETWMLFWRDMLESHPSAEHVGLAAKRYLWFALLSQDDWLERPLGDGGKNKTAFGDLERSLLKAVDSLQGQVGKKVPDRQKWLDWLSRLQGARCWIGEEREGSTALVEEFLIQARLAEGVDLIGDYALAWNQCEEAWQTAEVGGPIALNLAVVQELEKRRLELRLAGTSDGKVRSEANSSGVSGRVDRSLRLYRIAVGTGRTDSANAGEIERVLKEERAKAPKSLWWLYRSARTVSAFEALGDQAVALYRQMGAGVPAGSEAWLEARARTVVLLRKQGKAEQAEQLRALIEATVPDLSEAWKQRIAR